MDMKKKLGERVEFHTHTLFSDGELLPTELARRARVMDTKLITFTDHVDATNLEFVLGNLLKIREDEIKGIEILIGVELTHIPPSHICTMAKRAKELGAEVVVVHGETLVEPVENGTNKAAVECEYVDILAHPGLITQKEVKLAEKNDIFLEISARKGHCLSNGHVAKLALEVGAKLLVNTDAHSPEDLISQEFAYKVAKASGLEHKAAVKVVKENPEEFIRRVKQ